MEPFVKLPFILIVISGIQASGAQMAMTNLTNNFLLPNHTRPIHYNLTFDLNFINCSKSGDPCYYNVVANISVEILEETNEIVIHADHDHNILRIDIHGENAPPGMFCFITESWTTKLRVNMTSHI